MRKIENFREVTVWMWACPNHGVQPIHLKRRQVRICVHCHEELYETLDVNQVPS